MLESLLNCEIQNGVLGFTTLCVLLKVKYFNRISIWKSSISLVFLGCALTLSDDAADF